MCISALISRKSLLSLDAEELSKTMANNFLPREYRITLANEAIPQVDNRCSFLECGSVAVRWDGKTSPFLSLMHTNVFYLDKRKLLRTCTKWWISANAAWLIFGTTQRILLFDNVCVLLTFLPAQCVIAAIWSTIIWRTVFAIPIQLVEHVCGRKGLSAGHKIFVKYVPVRGFTTPICSPDSPPAMERRSNWSP